MKLSGSEWFVAVVAVVFVGVVVAAAAAAAFAAAVEDFVNQVEDAAR